MISLRYFRYSDFEVLHTKFFPDYTEEEIFKTLDRWDTHRYNDQPFEMFAICKNATLVGSISLLLHDDLSTVSIRPEILPEYRRKGYAKAAMTQAIVLLKTHEFWHLTAHIPKDNIAGIKLHESLGFTLDTETINIQGHEVYIYKKDL